MKKERPVYKRICPQCKSPDVSTDDTSKLTGALGLPERFVCNRCGHTGNFFPEVELSEITEFESVAEEKNLKGTKKD